MVKEFLRKEGKVVIQFYSIHPSFRFPKKPSFVSLSKGKKTPKDVSFRDILEAKRRQKEREIGI